MKISKIFNNNAVATTDSRGNELIVTGAGVGFQKKSGDSVDESKVTQSFYIRSQEKQKFYTLLERTPLEYFIVAEAIVEQARKTLGVEVSESIIIALTDHISFAIERSKQGIELPNLVLNEVKSLYRKEYEIGLWALDYIEERLGVTLSDDEAGYIAIHIVNAQSEERGQIALEIIEAVKDIISIIERNFDYTFDEYSLDYSRLMTHLKLFIQRLKSDEIVSKEFTYSMYDLLIYKNKKMESCLNEINQYIHEQFGCDISRTEEVYLMIHILKVID